MRGLSFLADDELFAIDVNLVQKVVRNMAITPIPTAPAAVVGICNLKGRVITILNLMALTAAANQPGHEEKTTVHAVILKPLSENDDQMGLLIDKPGDLVDITDSNILPPSQKSGEEKNFFISGLAEVNDVLYRIINIEAVIKQFRNADGHTPIDFNPKLIQEAAK